LKDKEEVYLKVKVVPNSGRRLVKKEASGILKVYLAKPAIEGRANKELIVLLAEYLGVKKRLIDIIKGEKAREKIVRVCQRV
jgi:uncharacterized protein